MVLRALLPSTTRSSINRTTMADSSSSDRSDIMVIHRIRTALELSRELLRASPIKPDLIPEYVALQMWPFVVPLYHGIEQALKCLLLLDTPTLNPRQYGHDLKTAFDTLHDDDRQHIEMHFKQHISLHADYRPDDTGITNAATFIEHINGTNQEGSITWRYLLLEGTEYIPPLHLWGMVEIWDAACCQMKTRYEDGHGLDSCSCLALRLTDLAMSQHTGRASPYEGFTDDVNEWFQRHGNIPLTAWVRLLCSIYRQAIYEVDAPSRLLSCLAEDANKLLEHLKSEPVGSDEWRLWTRIEETGGYLTWDYAEGMFRVPPTPPPLIPELPRSVSGVRVQVSDLILGDRIRIPTLSLLQWTTNSQSPSTPSDDPTSSAPAMYWPDSAIDTDPEDGAVSIPQRILTEPVVLGDLHWEIINVERIATPKSPVQERWITAKGRGAGDIRLRMRDYQEVLDTSFHASTYVPDSIDHETGRLFYFDPDNSTTLAMLKKLRDEGFRYKITSSTWSGHGDYIGECDPELGHYSIVVLLGDCRVPSEISRSLGLLLELLETPSYRLCLVNDTGTEWRVMAAQLDMSDYPLNQIGVVRPDRMPYPVSRNVESTLPTGPPTLRVDDGRAFDQGEAEDL